MHQRGVCLYIYFSAVLFPFAPNVTSLTTPSQPPRSGRSKPAASMSSSTTSRLESILDEALDEFEEKEMASKVSRMKIAPAAVGSDDDEEEEEDSEERLEALAEYERMKKIMSELDNPVYGNVVKQTLQSLNNTSEGSQTVDALLEQLQAPMANQTPLMAFPTDPSHQNNVEFTDRNIAGVNKSLSFFVQYVV